MFAPGTEPRTGSRHWPGSSFHAARRGTQVIGAPSRLDAATSQTVGSGHTHRLRIDKRLMGVVAKALASFRPEPGKVLLPLAIPSRLPHAMVFLTRLIKILSVALPLLSRYRSRKKRKSAGESL